MASIDLIANGVYTDTAVWSTGTVPGPGDTVNLNGYVVNINGNWSIENMTDNGLAGSGAYIDGFGIVLGISGTLTSSVTPTATTQETGAPTGWAPAYATINCGSNAQVTIGTITATADASALYIGVAPNCVINVGTINATGVSGGVIGSTAVGVASSYPENISLTIGSITATEAGAGFAVPAATLDIQASVSLTGACTATNGGTVGYGQAKVTASQTVTATTSAYAFGAAIGTNLSDIILIGNMSCTGAKASNFNSLVVHGTVTMSGTVSGDNGLYAAAFLYVDTLVLESDATLTLPTITLIKDLSVDGTEVYAVGSASPFPQTLLFYGGTANPTITGVSTYYLPSESQVVSGVNFLNSLVGNVALPPASDVLIETTFGPSTAPVTGTLVVPAEDTVLAGTAYGVGGNSDTGNVVLPPEAYVLESITFGANNSLTGTAATPPPSDVLSGIPYGPGGTLQVGTLTLPANTQVENGVEYGEGGNSLVGNVVLPIEANVAYGTEYGPNGTSLVGTLGAPPQGGNYCLVSDSYYNPDGSPYVGPVTVEILSLAANWPAGNNMGASMELATNSSGQLMDGTQPFVPLPYGASVQFSWGSITSGPWTVPSTPTATPPSFVGN